MTWFIHDHLTAMVPIEEDVECDIHLMGILEEVDRLNK